MRHATTANLSVRRTALAPIIVIWLSLSSIALQAAEPTAMELAADQMLSLPLDTTGVRGISNQTIEQRDFRLILDQGKFMSFAPLRLDSSAVYFGGIFVGTGRLQFTPPISMERQQLRRFLKSDSLNRSFERMMIILDSTEYRRLLTASAQESEAEIDYHALQKSYVKYMEEQWDRGFSLAALRNIANPLDSAYLLAMVELTEGGVVLYQNDPYEREQIGFFKREMEVVYRKVWQPLCQYALEADTVALDFSGRRKSSLEITHYDMDLLIKRNGEMISAMTVEMTWDTLPVRAFAYFLDSEMEVDSVFDANGKKIPFRRFKETYDFYGLWLLFDQPAAPGSQTSLRFYYHGDMAEKELGIFIIVAGDGWYPIADVWPVASYDIRMRSPSDYTVIAQGIQVESHEVKDTTFSHWQSRGATQYSSFNIGIFEKKQFTGKDSTVLDVYFCDFLHRSSGNKVKQVVGDLQGSLEFYRWLYGPLDYDTLVVSELIQNHSTSYPQFLLLGVFTWVDGDMWGYERLHRTHETAHQWFGSGIVAETYRDYWLSEGFAEYSSYMYLQAAAGNDQFLDRLNEHRKAVLLERKNAGAVALGPRAYNVKDEENYSIVVYARGALILHMLRNLLIDLQTMKEDRFYAMMRDWYTTYKGRQVTTRDFQSMVEKHAGVDMSWFFNQWVYNNYIPTYNFDYTVTPDTAGEFVANLHITQKEVPAEFVMYVPVEIQFEGGGKAYVRLLVQQPENEFKLQLPSKPKKITLNPFLSVLADVNQ